MLGRYSYALAISIPVFLFASFQIPLLLATDAKFGFKFEEYLRVSLAATGVSFLVVCGIVLWIGPANERAFVILAVGLCRALDNVSEVYFGLFQHQREMNRQGLALLIQSGLSLFSFAVVLVLTGSLMAAVAVLVVVNFVVLFGYVRPQAAKMLTQLDAGGRQLNWQRKRVFRLLAIGFPLAVVALMDALIYMVPRYFIEHHYGEELLGVFTAFFATLKVGSLVVLSLGQVSAPRLSALIAQSDFHAFKRLVRKLIYVCLLVSTVAMLGVFIGGDLLVLVLFGEQLLPYKAILFLLVLRTYFAFPASVLRSAAVAARQIGMQPVVLAVALTVDIVCCYFLVPAYQLGGACYSLIVATFVLFLSYQWLTRTPGVPRRFSSF
jgi:O-antigen/teichoic acid export membrane protein